MKLTTLVSLKYVSVDLVGKWGGDGGMEGKIVTVRGRWEGQTGDRDPEMKKLHRKKLCNGKWEFWMEKRIRWDRKIFGSNAKRNYCSEEIHWRVHGMRYSGAGVECVWDCLNSWLYLMGGEERWWPRCVPVICQIPNIE